MNSPSKGIYFVLSLCCLLATTSGVAQETVGLHLSNYLPATSIQLNPALAVDARTRLDVHLMGFSTFLRNNHAYLSSEGPGIRDIIAGAEGEIGEDLSGGDRKAYADASVDGPGFMLVKGRSSFGITSRFRAVSSAHRVPYELARFISEGFDFEEQQNIDYRVKDMQVAALAWGELGFTFGHMLRVTASEHINAAITVKRLYGQGAAALHFRELNYQMQEGTLSLDNFKGGYSFGAQDEIKANGWGFDLGVVYRKVIGGSDNYRPFSRSSKCQKSRYRYQLGVSLLDIGAMAFRENSSTVTFDNGSGDWEDILDFDPEDSEEIQDELEQQLEGDNNSFEREENLNVSLPSALSVQFDYDFDRGLHLGSVLQHNLTGADLKGPRRANLFSVVPRYERKFFEFALPLTVYEYERVMMGAAMRLYIFTIGSDDAFGLLTGDDVYGADLYFSLRVPLYKTFACDSKRRSSKKTRIAPCWGG